MIAQASGQSTGRVGVVEPPSLCARKDPEQGAVSMVVCLGSCIWQDPGGGGLRLG